MSRLIANVPDSAETYFLVNMILNSLVVYLHLFVEKTLADTLLFLKV
jgi:hypothetical protein